MKRLIIIASLLLLGGCAAFGPSADDPRLQSEFQAAREALQDARQWNAPTYQPNLYSQAESRFQAVRERHRNDPSESVISDYRMAQIQANRATIEAMADQLDEKNQELQDMRQKINQLSRTVQNQQGSLEDQAATIERLEADKQTMSDTITSLRNRLSELSTMSDSVTELNDMIAQQRDTIESQKEKIESLTDRFQEASTRMETMSSELESLRQQRDELRTSNRTLSDTVAKLRTRIDSRTAQIQSLRQENQEIARQMEEQLDEGTVRQEQDRVVVNLQERILFGLGSAHLKDEARSTIQQVVDVLGQYEDRRILVEGHTDDLPIKETLKDEFASNWELSAQRAINVVKYMIHGLGMNGERLSAVAYGQTQPLVPNTSTENRAKNRRVEIVLLPASLDMTPGDGDTTPETAEENDTE